MTVVSRKPRVMWAIANHGHILSHTIRRLRKEALCALSPGHGPYYARGFFRRHPHYRVVKVYVEIVG